MFYLYENIFIDDYIHIMTIQDVIIQQSNRIHNYSFLIDSKHKKVLFI